MTAFLSAARSSGLAAAVEILGVWGYVRADWNPAYGMTLFPFVFLAGLNALAVIPFIVFFAVLQIGGHEAARAGESADRLPARPRRPDPALHGGHRVGAR